MLASLVVQATRPRPVGEIGLNNAQASWLREFMGSNRRGPMREAARGLITFDSRPWLKEITAPTLVVGGTEDTGVPQHHFDALVNGIPGARGRLVDGAGHTLIWTHTDELAGIVETQWQVRARSRSESGEQQ